MSPHTIQLDHVSFAYAGEAVPSLNDVTTAFDKGECVCIEGPNGCGKSTLFRILLGLSYPTRGTYTLEGETVDAKSMKEEAFAAKLHRKIGFLFQNSEVQLFTGSVEEEIAFGLEQLGLPETEVDRRTEEYLRMFDLAAIRHKAPFNISGGEKKRTALAAVFAMEPEILVMDEPLSGLDEDGQAWLTDFIRGLHSKERLILIATHNRELSAAVADRVVRMDKNHRVI